MSSQPFTRAAQIAASLRAWADSSSNVGFAPSRIYGLLEQAADELELLERNWCTDRDKLMAFRVPSSLIADRSDEPRPAIREDGEPGTAAGDWDELRERFHKAANQVPISVWHDAGPKEVHTEWGVAYGGEDGNDCAGVLTYGGEAEAAEMVQWVNGGFLVRREVAVGPWVRVDGTAKEAASDG